MTADGPPTADEVIPEPARRPTVAFCVDRTLPPSYAVESARRAEESGLEQLWVIEDCFFTTGPTLAAAALATTERITVGLGILPVVARNPAVTAMELATLAALAPGRLVAGLGHGVQAWMAQMGARVPSPLTALEEVTTAVRRLLGGERVTVDGRCVRLDGVQLDRPPDPVPPIVLGVQGPRSLAVAGRVADGVILVELTGPTGARAALEQAGRAGAARAGFTVTLLSLFHVEDDRRAARRAMAPAVATRLAQREPGVLALPFAEELIALVGTEGPDALVDLPDDWWHELAPVGDPDDVAAFLDGAGAAGVDGVVMFPVTPPGDPAVARQQRDRLLALLPDLR